MLVRAILRNESQWLAATGRATGRGVGCGVARGRKAARARRVVAGRRWWRIDHVRARGLEAGEVVPATGRNGHMRSTSCG